MTKYKRVHKCNKCTRTGTVYFYMHSKLSGFGCHVWACADHAALSISEQFKLINPMKVDYIDK